LFSFVHFNAPKQEFDALIRVNVALSDILNTAVRIEVQLVLEARHRIPLLLQAEQEHQHLQGVQSDPIHIVTAGKGLNPIDLFFL